MSVHRAPSVLWQLYPPWKHTPTSQAPHRHTKQTRVSPQLLSLTSGDHLMGSIPRHSNTTMGTSVPESSLQTGPTRLSCQPWELTPL
jgi:hypothetical protein